MNISRRDNDKINSDRIIIELRMQSEDLINNIEHLSEENYKDEARKISQSISKRIAEIIEHL